MKLPANSWLGQRLRQKLVGPGAALLDIDEEELADAGISLKPRISGAHEGKSQTEDGEVLKPAVIIWASSFDPDFKWIELPVFEPNGFPKHHRGVVHSEPGLYFLGLPFLHRGNSSLIGGLGPVALGLATTIVQKDRRMPMSTFSEPKDEGQASAARTV